LPLSSTDPQCPPEAVDGKVRAAQALAPGSNPAAWNDDLDMAVRYLSRSHALVKDDASKLLLVAAQQRLFDLALETAYASYLRSYSEQDLERFFQLAESNSAILLKNRLNGFAGVKFAGVPDSLIALEQELATSMAQLPEDRGALAMGDL